MKNGMCTYKQTIYNNLVYTQHFETGKEKS